MGSGASKEELRTRDVVVIGAGYGGIQVKSRVIKETVDVFSSDMPLFTTKP